MHPYLEANGLMGSQGDADTKVIAANNFDHPGILGVAQAKTTQIGRHLQSKIIMVSQLMLHPRSVGAMCQSVSLRTLHQVAHKLRN